MVNSKIVTSSVAAMFMVAIHQEVKISLDERVRPHLALGRHDPTLCSNLNYVARLADPLVFHRQGNLTTLRHNQITFMSMFQTFDCLQLVRDVL